MIELADAMERQGKRHVVEVRPGAVTGPAQLDLL